ncbi:MAG TPA: tRNA uridine-5-carboxymethylaminomethyl(34) synthesis GTPase MnmE [Acholeplasmataceae bacterium]|nr:tRNA uridine-5-carboxymethylaminomethyl(34) synthesis GTPase MnmE [Acholeplasmataceae bacterium]
MLDTIAAISTAFGKGALSIVRMSGSEAIEIANKVFRGKNLKKVKSHTVHYGHIINENKEIIDEVLVTVFKAPKTFTREDVVEISCHGGIFVTNKILELLLSSGARLAEPGEFTKRAFMNGRIDLTQAEAVSDLIEARTQSSLKMANMGLRGDIRKLIESFRSDILTCIARIEVNIDYPEYEDEEEITTGLLIPIITKLLKSIDEIIEKSETSQIIKEGIDTAIIGKPNVGKSSLLNSLLRQNKAIVTNIAGTTRDVVEGVVNVGGVILNLIDTAGIRETKDVVERIGVEKTKEVLKDAQLVILVFDYSSELEPQDLELLESTKDKTRIIVINKSDLNKKIDLSVFDDYILISTFNHEDIEKVENKIKEITNISDITEIDSTYIGNARHIAKLKEAKRHLESGLSSAEVGEVIDMINIDLTLAWQALGEIIGENNPEALLDELFSKFCLGK